MGLIIQPKYFSEKPPLGVQINWGHPLAKGLVGCWLFNEGGGTIFNDLVGFRNSTQSNTSWRVSSGGIGVDFVPASTPYIEVSTTAILSTLINSSMEVFFITDHITEGNGDPLYCERTTDTPIWKFELKFGFSYLGFTHRDNAGTLTRVWSSKGICDGKVHHAVLTKTGTAIKIYIDGYYDVGGTLGGTDILTAGNCRWGDDYFDTGAQWDGQIILGRLYNRTLSPQEVQWLYTEPYAMFQQPRKYWFVQVAAGGLSIPVAMHHYMNN